MKRFHDEAAPKPGQNATLRDMFAWQNARLLEHYPHHDAELLADLYEVRHKIMPSDDSRFFHIFANFYDAEPKVGWQDYARRIVARAKSREVAP